MLLAIDIGNSNISVGLFDQKRDLKFLSSIDTDSRENGGSDQHRPDEHLLPVSIRPA